MPEKQDKVSNRINAIAKLILAIATLLGLFIGVPKAQEIMNEGEEQSTKVSQDEATTKSVIVQEENDGLLENHEPNEKVEFELIRDGYLLKETRYITFDNEKFRLSIEDINSSNQSAIAIIKDKRVELLKQNAMKVGEIFVFEIQSTLYKVHLYGIKHRITSSNLAYFNIYKSK